MTPDETLNLTPTYEYMPSKERVSSSDPEFGLGQVLGGLKVDAQQLSQGKVIIQGVAQRILIGDATGPLTGVGIFMGSDQQATVGYDFRVGDPSGQYIHWDASAGTFIIAGTIVIGGQYRTVAVGDNIQTAIDAVNAAGGGTVVLQNGTHTPGQNITLYSKITLEGQNGESAIIDFAGGSYQVKGIGSEVYTTGTVSVSNNSTTVTGSGTSWSTNLTAGQYIMLSGVWYPITNVGSNTSLTIAIPYADTALSGASYTAATILSNVHINSVTVRNSAISAVKFQYVDNLFIDDLTCQTSLVGTELDTCSQVVFDLSNMTANYTNYVFTNTHFMTHNGNSCVDAVTGNGYTLTGVTNSNISATFVLNSAADGINLTSCANMRIDVVSVENAGSGIEFVSGNDNIIFGPARVESNASDGIKLTATSDNIFITNAFLKNNTGYGINIAASSCDNAVITSNNFTGNTTAAVNDSGTGTVIRGNVGANDNSTSSSITGIVASDTLVASADTERTSTQTSLTEIKQITIRVGGVARIKFDYANIDGTSIDAQIYRNGVAYGTLVNTSGSSYLTSSEDLAFAPFDAIQLYIRRTGGSGSVKVRNFRVYYTASSLSPTTVDTD